MFGTVLGCCMFVFGIYFQLSVSASEILFNVCDKCLFSPVCRVYFHNVHLIFMFLLYEGGVSVQLKFTRSGKYCRQNLSVWFYHCFVVECTCSCYLLYVSSIWVRQNCSCLFLCLLGAESGCCIVSELVGVDGHPPLFAETWKQGPIVNTSSCRLQTPCWWGTQYLRPITLYVMCALLPSIWLPNAIPCFHFNII